MTDNRILVDYTAIIDVETRVGMYIGAGNFARELIRNLIEAGVAIYVIVKEDYYPKIGCEAELFANENILIRTDDILNVDFCREDVLLLVATNGYLLEKIRKIKRTNKIKVYAFIHDKQHNIKIADPTDRYYKNGIYRSFLVSYVAFWIKHLVFDFMYPIWIANVDKVFTVSNYSIQMLHHRNVRRMILYYQDIPYKECRGVNIEGLGKERDYILFVSGGRCEKNLARALKAFFIFKMETENENKMIVTGIEYETFRNIVRGIKIPETFINENVKIYGYVNEEQLARLYKDCRYLLFISKGEGFGLPVLEAMSKGKTALASWQTSIPEVAGSVLYYVDAYNIRSIVNGMHYLSFDENLSYRERLVAKKLEIIEKQIALDKEVILSELLS